MFLSDLFRSRGGVSVIINVAIIHSFAFRIREGTISETTGLKNVLKSDKMLQNHSFHRVRSFKFCACLIGVLIS